MSKVTFSRKHDGNLQIVYIRFARETFPGTLKDTLLPPPDFCEHTPRWYLCFEHYGSEMKKSAATSWAYKEFGIEN